MNETATRLRPHPADRFAGASHAFDLLDSLAKLRAETHAGESGHRQVTIFHRAPVTQVLFSFDAGGELADHAANGLVTIHAIEGRLTVEAEGETYSLSANQLVVLSPGVRHSVKADEPSAMLLTVHLEKAK